MINKNIAVLVLVFGVVSACSDWEDTIEWESRYHDDSGSVVVSKIFEEGGEEYQINANYATFEYGDGGDGEFLTGDDRLLYYTKTTKNPSYVSFQYSDTATIIESKVISAPGPDGLWFTADDGGYNWRTDPGLGNYPVYNVSYQDGDVKRDITYADLGCSTECFDKNKINLENSYIKGYIETVSIDHADSIETQTINIDHAGKDLIWFTSDDKGSITNYYGGTLAYIDVPIEFLSDITFDDGRFVQTAYHDAGEDGLRFTEDDEVLYVKSISAPQQLSDNVFETIEETKRNSAFGEEINIMKVQRDGSGELLKTIKFSSAGSDKEWLTDDDVISTAQEVRMVSELESETIIDTVSIVGAGVDGLWFTEDDVIAFFLRQTTSEDTSRKVVKNEIFDNWGEDGKWFTKDDLFDDSASFVSLDPLTGLPTVVRGFEKAAGKWYQIEIK